MLFGCATGTVVCLMLLCMILCTLLLCVVLKYDFVTAIRQLIDDDERHALAAANSECTGSGEEDSSRRDVPRCVNYGYGSRKIFCDSELPFIHFWEDRCEDDWRKAYMAFSWGVPFFLCALACSGWIKFYKVWRGGVTRLTHRHSQLAAWPSICVRACAGLMLLSAQRCSRR